MMHEEPILPTLQDWLNRERISLRPNVNINGQTYDMGDALLFDIPGAIDAAIKQLRTITKSAND